ncbi:LysE family transporter [Patescibacteria group bacterium]|nr:LysE family transporter [Patescibacteria group bacterium]
MENLILIGTITLMHFLALIIPGPDFIMAVKNSLGYSRKTGIWTALDFSAGIMVHILYCLAGLAIIISQSIIVFNSIKLLGAAYLVHIGISAFLSKSQTIQIDEQIKKEDIVPMEAFKLGFLTNILNPKVTLFFLGLFTLVVSPNTPQYVLISSSLIMIVNTFLWFSLVAIFFTQNNIRNIYNNFQQYLNKILGGLLILLGVKIALSDNK